MALSPKDRLAAGVLRVADPGRRKDGTAIGLAPYFGAILRGLIRREITHEQAAIMEALGMSPTLAVSRDGVLWWWPKFVEKCSADELAGVLVHEAMHLVLKHAERGAALGIVPEPSIEMHSRARRWNRASDCAINDDVRKLIALPKDGLFPETFGFPKGLTAEAYYKLLEEQEEKKGGKGGKGAGGKSGAGKPGNVTSGHCGGCAQHPIPGEPGPSTEKGEGRSDAELERMRRSVAEAVKEYTAKGRGTVPGSLVRWSDELLAPPKIDWRTRLARTIRGAVAYKSGSADYCYTRVSRRQAGIGFGVGRPVMPALHQPVPRVMVAVDSSGSMGEADLSTALSETNGVLRAAGGDVQFCVCDAAIHTLKPVKTWKEAAAGIIGGGGTDFRPIFEAADNSKPAIDVLIFFTDGCGPAPAAEPTKYKTVWCLIGKYAQEPCTWGEFVHIEEEKEAA